MWQLRLLLLHNIHFMFNTLSELILNESEELSGKPPVYEVFDEELRRTIFAAHEIPQYYSK